MTETKKPLPEQIAEWQALEAEIAQREASGQSPCAWIFDSEEMARAILPDLIAAYNALLSLLAAIDELEAENKRLRRLLTRLWNWDHFDGAADGVYWRAEIEGALLPSNNERTVSDGEG